MIEVDHLSKRYGKTVAVDEVSFTVRPGQVTGFLGPNGAGKSTTMRMILGLDRPNSGQALVDGRPYQQLADPLRSIGALLDAKAIVGGRSAANHLTWLADSNGIARSPVRDVLDTVGLSVFLSSHVMSEMAQTADHLIVIGPGRIIADAGTSEFINGHTAPSDRVRAVEQTDLAAALNQRGALIECGSDGALA